MSCSENPIDLLHMEWNRDESSLSPVLAVKNRMTIWINPMYLHIFSKEGLLCDSTCLICAYFVRSSTQAV